MSMMEARRLSKTSIESINGEMRRVFVKGRMIFLIRTLRLPPTVSSFRV